MKKFVSCALLCGMLISSMIFLTGCGDPTKAAGRGGTRQQSYGPDGRYK